ncbi:ferredoxin [Chlamydia sp.]|uniref:ferredoxin n=1 Tax=Chlamydia sp. TaxID=35827 RepID=UPI0025B9D349|nr:ferredoxin [Chlamydia sp.]MBQ8498286.1 ferredoxin [Chlamydia sp.]
MKKKEQALCFSCPHCCDGNVAFSVIDLENVLTCDCCDASFVFEAGMCDAIRKFSALCLRIYEARSILGEAAVSVSVQGQSVEVPFQLLFSRFPVFLNLDLAGRPIHIRFIFDSLRGEVLYHKG